MISVRTCTLASKRTSSGFPRSHQSFRLSASLIFPFLSTHVILLLCNGWIKPIGRSDGLPFYPDVECPSIEPARIAPLSVRLSLITPHFHPPYPYSPLTAVRRPLTDPALSEMSPFSCTHPLEPVQPLPASTSIRAAQRPTTLHDS